MRKNQKAAFKEEFTNLNAFLAKEIKLLKIRKKSAKLFWTILTILVFLFNLSTLIIASVAIAEVLKEQTIQSSKPFNFETIGPTFIVAALVLINFILTFVISVYQGIRKTSMYAEGMREIQYEAIKWERKIGEYKNKDRNELIKFKTHEIMTNICKNKKHMTLKKSFAEVFIGDEHD